MSTRTRRLAEHADVLRPGKLSRRERHLVGDHRTCGSLCKRSGHDDRVPPKVYEYTENTRLQHRFVEEVDALNLGVLSDAKRYAIGAVIRAEMRGEFRRAFPWLRLED